MIKVIKNYIVDTASRTDKNDNSEDKYNPSVIVLLLMRILDAHCGRTGWTWGKEHFKTIESSKKKVINSNTAHFGSEGYYFFIWKQM